MASISSRRLLRPVGFDELGLRRAISDRMLPFLVAAMAVLAAMALAGWVGAASLARHWQQGAASALTVQVARPTEPAAQGGGSRLERVVALLLGTPGIADAHPLTDEELGDLLRPWLGQWSGATGVPAAGGDRRPAFRSGTGTGRAGRIGWMPPRRARWWKVTECGSGVCPSLARSLQACAGLALLLVAGVAAAVIAVATRAGLAARREAIEIVHGLGATDSYIASRFAGRATLLAASGGIAGAVVALPVLLTLASMAAPFAGWCHRADIAGRHSWRAARRVVARPAGAARRRRRDRLHHRARHRAPLAATVAMTSAGFLGRHRAGGWRAGSGYACSPPYCCLGIGFAWFVHMIDRPAHAPPHADGIVAFTGGADRVETALRLLSEGRADKLLLSGDWRRRGTGRIGPSRRGQPNAARYAGHPRPRRRLNPWQCRWRPPRGPRANAIHSLIVVTASYHMPRAMAEIERVLPDTALYPLPVMIVGAARRPAVPFRLIAEEYFKFLAARVGLSSIVPLREPQVAYGGHAG